MYAYQTSINIKSRRYACTCSCLHRCMFVFMCTWGSLKEALIHPEVLREFRETRVVFKPWVHVHILFTYICI